MWAEGFLSTHMPTWSCEEITQGLPFGFGNGTLLSHRAPFLPSSIHVHEAPAWIWLHRKGVPTPLGLGLETVSAFRVINRILRHPITAMVLTSTNPAHSPAPKAALKQSYQPWRSPTWCTLDNTQVWPSQNTAFTLHALHVCDSVKQPVSFHLPSCSNPTAAGELFWEVAILKYFQAAGPKYKGQWKKLSVTIMEAEGSGGLWVLWRHTEVPGLNMNPVCLGPCQGTLWAQPLWTDLPAKEAVAIKSSWATPKTQLPSSV